MFSLASKFIATTIVVALGYAVFSVAAWTLNNPVPYGAAIAFLACVLVVLAVMQALLKIWRIQ